MDTSPLLVERIEKAPGSAIGTRSYSTPLYHEHRFETGPRRVETLVRHSATGRLGKAITRCRQLRTEDAASGCHCFALECEQRSDLLRGHRTREVVAVSYTHLTLPTKR